MVRKILILVLVLQANFLEAQFLPMQYDTLINSHELILSGGVDYYGSSMEKDLTSKIIKGGMITSEIKDRSLAKHGAINRLGGVGFSSIDYRNFIATPFKKKNWGYTIKAGYDAFGGLLYAKDFYGLALYGNQSYQGETIDMSGTNLSVMTYQKVGFGLINKKTKSNVSLNIYNISNRIHADLRDFEIRQDDAGDTISFLLAGEFEVKNNNKFNQGVGFGVDLNVFLPIEWGKDKTAYIQVKAQNIGFAYMYEKQRVYSFDTSFVFAGLKLDELVGENSILGDSLNILDSLGIHSAEKTRTVLLPGYIQVGKIVTNLTDKKIQSFFGIRLYPTLIYTPFVYAGINYRPKKWVNIGANASYGGFGKFKTGLYASVNFSNYSIGLSTENLVGVFSKRGSGESLFIRLRWAI